ncbi:hypothetical protein BSKO_13949 [Bryopsis sp. KO-2023]|nr:hypothetical protein BSKO_13949 [Bryopsis sp. KO-2023]
MARSTLSDFELLEELGSGSFGIVWKGRRKVDDLLYAIKQLRMTTMSRQEKDDCFREVTVLASLDHPNVTKYYDSFVHEESLYIVMEYAEGGTLQDLIKKQDGPVPEDMIWKVFMQVLQALHYIHSKKILHRDIKSMNIFLDRKSTVKLGDLGVARIMSAQTDFVTTMVGTPYYLSPEQCENKPYNDKSDVWALGVVMYECCTKKHPFDAGNQGALILKILRGRYPPLAGYSTELIDMIKRCLTQVASRRPDTARLLRLPVLSRRARKYGIKLAQPDPGAPPVTRTRSKRAATRSAPASRPSTQHGNPKNVEPLPQKGRKRDIVSARARSQNPPQADGQSAGRDGFLGRQQRPVSAYRGKPTTSALGAAFKRPTNSPRKVSAHAGCPSRTPDLGVIGGQVDMQNRNPRKPEDSSPHKVGQKFESDPAVCDKEMVGGLVGVSRRDLPASTENSKKAMLIRGGTSGSEQEQAQVDLSRTETQSSHNSLLDSLESNSDSLEEGDQRLGALVETYLSHKQKCKDIIGTELFDKLYSTVKTHTDDLPDISISELSRVIFKVIPYDKAEAISYIYKMLYIESQLNSK